MKTLTVPATLDSLSAIGQFVLEVAEEGSLTKMAAYRARLAVDEIATNAIHYGEAGGDGQGVLEVRGEVSEQAVTFTLEDAGTPFDPRQAAPPGDMDLPPEERSIGGLGVYLAMTGVDHFSYERVGDRNRNIFVVNRTPPPPDGSRESDVPNPVKKESRT